MNCTEQARQAIKDMINVNPASPVLKRRTTTTNERNEVVYTSTEATIPLLNPVRLFSEANYGSKEENGGSITYKIFGFGLLTEHNEVVTKGDKITIESKNFEVDSHAKELRIQSEVYGKKYTLRELK